MQPQLAGPSVADFVAGWQLDLYRDPIYAGLLAGAVLGYLGVFVVLRRMVFLTAAVGQAAGLGVALAFYAQIHLSLDVSPTAGAMVAALLFTAVLSAPLESLRVSREAVLALAYLGAWATSVLVGSRITQEAHDTSTILFGSAVLVSSTDLWMLAAVGGLSLLGFVTMHRGLSFAVFDRQAARVQRLPVAAIELSAWVLTALCISVATRALGVLPVFAFSVLPAVAALRLCARLPAVLVTATAFGALSGGAGYLLAFFGDLPVGACQATSAVLMLLAALPVGWWRDRQGR